MNTYSVTDLRHNTNSVLAASKQHGYISILKNSKQDAFLVDPKYFLALQETYDDYLDILEYDAGKQSLQKGKPISLDSL